MARKMCLPVESVLYITGSQQRYLHCFWGPRYSSILAWEYLMGMARVIKPAQLLEKHLAKLSLMMAAMPFWF